MNFRKLATLAATLAVTSTSATMYTYISDDINHLIDDKSASPYLNSISVSGVG